MLKFGHFFKLFLIGLLSELIFFTGMHFEL
jgi:hypothetical protein